MIDCVCENAKTQTEKKELSAAWTQASPQSDKTG